MSGPIWRYEKCNNCTCAGCLRKVDHAFREGEVEDAEFHQIRVFCEDCYRENAGQLQKSL